MDDVVLEYKHYRIVKPFKNTAGEKCFWVYISAHTECRARPIRQMCAWTGANYNVMDELWDVLNNDDAAGLTAWTLAYG